MHGCFALQCNKPIPSANKKVRVWIRIKDKMGKIEDNILSVRAGNNLADILKQSFSVQVKKSELGEWITKLKGKAVELEQDCNGGIQGYVNGGLPFAFVNGRPFFPALHNIVIDRNCRITVQYDPYLDDIELPKNPGKNVSWADHCAGSYADVKDLKSIKLDVGSLNLLKPLQMNNSAEHCKKDCREFLAGNSRAFKLVRRNDALRCAISSYVPSRKGPLSERFARQFKFMQTEFVYCTGNTNKLYYSNAINSSTTMVKNADNALQFNVQYVIDCKYPATFAVGILSHSFLSQCKLKPFIRMHKHAQINRMNIKSGKMRGVRRSIKITARNIKLIFHQFNLKVRACISYFKRRAKMGLEFIAVKVRSIKLILNRIFKRAMKTRIAKAVGKAITKIAYLLMLAFDRRRLKNVGNDVSIWSIIKGLARKLLSLF